jgi:hypothetical protein
MFPQPPQPDLNKLEEGLAKQQQEGGKKEDPNAKKDDFFFNHGGKIAFLSISLIVYIVYSFYKGGAMRTEMEEFIESEYALEPNEVNELRSSNRITPNVYRRTLSLCSERYPDGHLSYGEFIAIIQEVLGDKKLIQSSHLFERLIYMNFLRNKMPRRSNSSITTGNSEEKSNDGTGSTYSEMNTVATSENVVNKDNNAENWYHEKLPLEYLLTAFNMTIGANAYERIDALYDLARDIESQTKSEEDMLSNENIEATTVATMIDNLCVTNQVRNCN